jgi:hypothetical protein
MRKLAWLILFLAGFGFAATTQDLDNELKNLGNEVTVTTETTNETVDLLNKTNVTQSAVLVAGIASTTAGSTASIPLTLIPGPLSISALQFSIFLPTGITVSSVTAGPAALAAGKSVDFSAGNQMALIFGVSSTPIREGVVAIVKVAVSSASLPGFYSFGLSSPIAADPKGTQIPLSLTSGTIKVR